MVRRRCFLIFDLLGEPLQIPRLVIQTGTWIDTGCGVLDDVALASTTVTEEQRVMLSDIDLLPSADRQQARIEGVLSGGSVFRRRIVDKVLPTLVAAYRSQCFLPEKSLRQKGILTWLVSVDGTVDEARFLENFEGLRLL